MFSSVTLPQVVPGNPRGRTRGSLQRVAEIFIFDLFYLFYLFYKVIFQVPFRGTWESWFSISFIKVCAMVPEMSFLRKKSGILLFLRFWSRNSIF